MKHKKELILATELNLLIIVWSLLILQGVLLFSDNIYFNNDNVLTMVNPELKEEITFIYTDSVFPHNAMFPEKNNLGLYIPYLNIIKINVNEQDLLDNKITLEELTCHELCHHKWHKFMAKEEKQFWQDKFDKIPERRKPIYKNANELHAEWCEIDLTECFY